MKALYVGKIEDIEKEERFKELMSSLFDAYNSSTDGDTCIIYNYYSREDVVETGANEDIFKDIKPAPWAEEWAKKEGNRASCIEIINHMLDLSEFGEYLRANEPQLTDKHDICCCVTYYDNRAGEVRFHQDSLGAELFVSLIYRTAVYSPELKLKKADKFEKRLDKIKDTMPSYFIGELKELYKNVQQEGNNLVSVKGKSLALSPNLIEWPGRVEGPGGIVGFVDELMIHTTPYMHHRTANGPFLLKVLDYIKDKNLGIELDREKLISAVDKLKEIVEEKRKENRYITTDELWNIEQGDAASKKVFDKLSKLLRSLDKAIRNYKATKVAELEKWSLELGITPEEILKATDSTLGASSHSLYNGRPTSYVSTDQVKRKLSMKLKRKSSLIGAEEGLQRSFLRVWVIALPK